MVIACTFFEQEVWLSASTNQLNHNRRRITIYTANHFGHDTRLLIKPQLALPHLDSDLFVPGYNKIMHTIDHVQIPSLTILAFKVKRRKTALTAI